MSRLHLTPPETMVPLKTATRLLRIALALKVVPVVLAVIVLLILYGTRELDVLTGFPASLQQEAQPGAR